VPVEPLKPVYLITGSDLPKISLALRRLRRRFEQGSIEHVFAESASGADVVAGTNALGLFGGGERLVVVGGIERWKKADVEAVAAYLESPTPGAVLALVGDPSRLAGLEAACRHAGDVLRFDVPLKTRGKQLDFPVWVRAQFERADLRVDPETAERLVELVGEDAFALQNEVEKLAAWAAGASVGVREVEALAVPMHETSNFALGDAWGSRDMAGVLAACEAKLLVDEPFVIAARLAGYVGSVRRVQALLEQDLGVREIAERLGLKDFPARKQAAQAANYSREELGNAVVRLGELDFALKGGSRLSPELELERALVEVTRLAEPRAGHAI
jgi:DNA polymerase-3 subunit delta